MVKRVRQTSDCFIVISISLLEITRKLINRFTTPQLVIRFIRAVCDGEVSKVKEMLDVGVPVDSEDGVGLTALQWAAWKNRTDVMELLLSRGADVNKQSDCYHATALHLAAFCNNTDVIKVLLKIGASTNIKDRYGDTPIDLARLVNNKAAVRLLERH